MLISQDAHKISVQVKNKASRQSVSIKDHFKTDGAPPSSAKLYENNSARKRQLDTCLAKMIVKDIMPLSIVEGAGFLEFTQRLDPRYKPPRWVL